MTAAMMPEDRSSGIALPKFGWFAEVVHAPERAFGEVDGLGDATITDIPRRSLPRVQRRLHRYGD